MIINYLAIIPARSGSKGLPHKNIKKIMGKTLIEITSESAEKAEKIDGIFFSSDSKEYINIYKNLNLKKDVTGDYIRPDILSSDTASSTDYINDCLKYLRMRDIQVINFVLLQVTSPLRQYSHINAAINLYNSQPNKSLVSVYESINHPYNSFFYNKQNNKFEPVVFKKATRRQDYPKSVSLNGAIYIKNVEEYIAQNGIIMTEKTILFTMDKLLSIDIDDEQDFYFAELIYKNMIDTT
jgi:CMP-N,N'-diacetyllegionaminic acid synthase